MDHWSWFDYDAIRRLYPELEAGIAQIVGNRSKTNIDARAERLGTKPFKPFSDSELELASKFGPEIHGALIFFLPERAPSEIKELLKCVNC